MISKISKFLYALGCRPRVWSIFYSIDNLRQSQWRTGKP